MVKLGYQFAYRVLDAQFAGVPQRRRRVFVVGYLGDWRRAAAVLFERHSLQGHSPPSRETGEGTPGFTASSFGGYSEGVGTLSADGGDYGGGTETIIASTGHTAHCLNAGGMGRQDYETETLIAFQSTESMSSGDNVNVAPTLRIGSNGGGQPPAIAYRTSGNCGAWDTGDRVDALTTGTDPNSHLIGARHVRRLTPEECEALQGFPRGYTLIPYRNGMSADGPRYKALGNSFAVPVVRWIGERIAAVEALEIAA
jgi:DNA (cytosine-5)-methyltransferase 1